MATTAKPTISGLLDEATRESLLFLTKAFRGGAPLEEKENRVLLGAATTTLGSWSRFQSTQSAREQTRFAMAIAISRENGTKVGDAMQITMPEHRTARALLGSGQDKPADAE
jgi:hypothetical protein